MTKINSKELAVVVIGRNEGSRLLSCFESLKDYLPRIVYVDSGSIDESIGTALQYGITVVTLNSDLPFTAARARNAGFAKVLEIWKNVRYIQFIDGDCELNPQWIPNALENLTKETSLGIVCGRRREKYPSASLYNQLCDIEWDTPVGSTQSCGGDALVKVEAFAKVNGFDSSLIAGEEPEMGYRMIRQGYSIERIHCEMTLHDANMKSFHQWMKRTIRSGYAYANGYWLHHTEPAPLHQKRNISILFYSLLVPTAALTIIFLKGFPEGALFFLFIQLSLVTKVFLSSRQRTNSRFHLLCYSIFVSIGKFCEGFGQLKFLSHLLLNKKGTLIEYK